MNPTPKSSDAGELTIFDAARQIPDAPARAAYLDTACAGKPELRQRVENLLKASSRADQFLATDPLGLNKTLVESSATTLPSEGPGTVIDKYKLLEKLGEGGFGVVYMAEQKQPIKRRVALKIIKVGMDTREVVARFEAERQALAIMDHQNIAKVHDAGATASGRPYFVMELVRGVKITDYCDQRNLPMRERLNLFVQVCQAVQHAHQKGIIHRDLKPSNILVADNDGTAVPKIIDFGIAKATQMELTEKTVFTRFHHFLGTPAYISPEQAEITNVDIDTRSDIYSLGVLLYELLTGKTPFDAKELLQSGLDEMRRTIREEEPARPSTCLNTLGAEELTTAAKRRGSEPPKLISQLRGDLDWIAMKCLEKDRARRYETANGLAMDIQRHLNNEPVVARPRSRFYQFQKTVRRHKLGFAAAGAVILALLLGLGASTWSLLKERRARQEKAVEAAKSRQVAQFLEQVLGDLGPLMAGSSDKRMLRALLDRTADRASKQLASQPDIEAELQVTIGDVYYLFGARDKAAASYRQSLATRRKLFGNDHPAVAESLDDLGFVLCEWADTTGESWRDPGYLSEAESSLREAVDIRTRWNDQAGMARSLVNLASVLKFQGKLLEAETVWPCPGLMDLE